MPTSCSRTSVFVAIFVLMLASTALNAQSLGASGSIQGKVVDASGAVIPNASVDVHNPVTGFQRTTTTDATGSFVVRNLPQNPYHIFVKAEGFAAQQHDVDVRSGVPIDLAITMKVTGANTTVEVESNGGSLLESDPSAHTDVDEKVMSRIPMENTASGLSQLITLSSPGVVADSNGFFHPLGDHAQASFSIDNQPIGDQQSRVYSNQIAPSAIQSLELITGVSPAEYGDKTSLIAVATTKSGLGLTRPTGSVSFDYGSFGSAGTTLNLGVGNAKFGNFISVNGLQTGRFLDGPEFQPLHDRGNSENAFDRLDYQISAADSLHLNLFAARSWFQIPNTFDQQASGQDQRQQIKTFDIAPGWTHLFNAATLFTVNAFVRQDRLQYYSSSNLFSDQPETAGQGRRLTNSGLKTDISYAKGHHNFKAGFQYSHTALSENFRFGITDPTINPVCLDNAGAAVTDPTITDPNTCAAGGFSANPNLQVGLVPFDLTRNGQLFQFKDNGSIDQQALYVQDNVTIGPWTWMLGVRGDHYAGLTEKYALNPRVGFSYHLGKTNTVLRGSYARTLETPYNENLLFSSATGSGGLAANIFGATVTAPLQPGIRNQFNAGFEQALGKFLVIDGDYFWKYTHNAYDFNVLGDTPIAFPIAWNKSKLDGFSIRVSTPDIHGFRAYTSIGHTRARYFNPEVGGLFFDNNPPTGVFRIDHDQAFQQTTNIQYSFLKKMGGFASFTWRYDSGLVNGSVPDYATALSLTADQQSAIGLFCGNVFATLATPITSCSDPNRGATRINILPDGTENDDKNPPRIAPRHLFDMGMGFDNLFRTDHYKWNAKLSVVNLTNKSALYNFLSTFSGTHFVTPRSYQASIGFTF
ncbi:MAG: TonB-dependent receptor [Acidobacteriales bacterium]|nr:TonB-dependent receptor [Terriglobales bacterium]